MTFVYSNFEDPNKLASGAYAKINGKSTALSVAAETNLTLNAYTICKLISRFSKRNNTNFSRSNEEGEY